VTIDNGMWTGAASMRNGLLEAPPDTKRRACRPIPCGWRRCEERAVAIPLLILVGRGLRDTVGAGIEAVRIVEAAILAADHDDVLDLPERGIVVGAGECRDCTRRPGARRRAPREWSGSEEARWRRPSPERKAGCNKGALWFDDGYALDVPGHSRDAR
jgi:hypothetical protein